MEQVRNKLGQNNPKMIKNINNKGMEELKTGRNNSWYTANRSTGLEDQRLDEITPGTQPIDQLD